jgi:2-haloacid dehalogenase
MRKYNYLTFDCYGTLIDWRRGVVEGLTNAFGRFPLGEDELLRAYVETEAAEERNYRKYRSVMEATAAALAARFGLEPKNDGPESFAESLPTWPAFPDSANSLRVLGEMGFKRYILSNVDEDLLDGTIRKAGLEVDGFVTAEEVRSYKPSHGHWQAFLKKTGSKKEEELHVAQSLYHDIIPAEDIGIDTAWVNRYGQPLSREAMPLFICEGLEDLPRLLR